MAVNDPAGHPYTAAFSSGGGFSNIYPIAPWQKNAVETYFNNNDPGYKYYNGNSSFGQNGGIYNRAGRGYPDVSANGDNIATFNKGAYSSQGGTSASTPIFAAIINRINEARLNAGKKVVGFISPALYQNPGMLNDITSGNNAGCGTDGFSAVPGEFFLGGFHGGNMWFGNVWLIDCNRMGSGEWFGDAELSEDDGVFYGIAVGW